MTHLTFIRYFVPDSNEFAPGWYQTRNEGRTRIGDVPLSLSDALYDGPNRVIIDDNTPETNSLPVSGGKGVDEFLITRTANSVVIDDDSGANVIVFERDVVITSIERQAGSEGASVAQYVITLSSGKTITLRNPASFTFQHLGDVTRTDPISAEDFVTAYEDGFAASDAFHPDIIGDASGPSGVQGPIITGTATGAVYEGDLSTSGDLDVNDDTLLASTTPFTISTQGTYGTASIGDDGEWVYTLDNGNTDVRALNSGDTLTDTFVVDVNLASGRAETQTVTITISGRTDVFGTNGRDSSLGDASTSDNQAIFGFNNPATGPRDGDTLTGGSGDDLLVGGYGVDTIDLSAGGIDTVVYRINSSDTDGRLKAEDGTDTVIEFTPGEDKLVILDVNGSPTTLASLFDSLGRFRFELRIHGDDGDFNLSSRELDGGARYSIRIGFQAIGTDDGDPASGSAGNVLQIVFDRVTSEALNDMAVRNTLTGGTNHNGAISTVAQLSSLFGGFGRPGYDAALDDGGFISIIGPDDLPDSYFAIISGDETGSVTEGGAPGDDNTGTLTAPGHTITLVSKETTDSPGMSTGTYGVMRFNASSGEWVYTLDDRAEALADQQTETESFIFSAGDATFEVTITITGANDAPVVESGNEIVQQAGRVGQEIEAIDLSGLFTDVDTGDTLTLTVMVLSSDGSTKSGLDTLGLEYDSDTKMITGTLLNSVAAGPYTIEVIATDGSGGESQPSTFDIVVAPDIAPVIGGDMYGTIAEDAADPVTGTLSVTGTSDPIVFSSVTNLENDRTVNGSGVILTTYGRMSFDGTTWSYSVRRTRVDPLSEGEEYIDTFTFTAGGASFDVVITLTGVDDPTVLSSLGNRYDNDAFTNNSRASLGDPLPANSEVILRNLFSDPDDDLTITFLVYYLTELDSNSLNDVTYKVYDSTDPSQTLEEAIGLTYDPVTTRISGTFKYRGWYRFDVTASDGRGNSPSVKFWRSISQDDDSPPVIGGDDENSVIAGNDLQGSASGVISITDRDQHHPITFPTITLVSNVGTYGTMTFDGRTWTYTVDNDDPDTQALAGGAEVNETFTFRASGASDFTVTITISGVNDAPVVESEIAEQAGRVGQEITAIDLSGLFTDVDTGDTFTLAVMVLSSDGNTRTALDTLGLEYDSDIKMITGTLLNSVVAGPYTIEVIATDGSGDESQPSTFDIVVAPDNPPVIGNDSPTEIGEDAGSPITGTLTITDQDSSGPFQPIVLTDDSDGTDDGIVKGEYGTLTFDSNTGAWSYMVDDRAQVLNDDTPGTDRFVFTSEGATDFELVITVTGANDDPAIAMVDDGSGTGTLVSASIDAQSGTEGEDTVIDLSGVFIDPDDVLDLVPTATDSGGTSVVFDGTTNSFSYDSDTEMLTITLAAAGTYTVTVTASDGNGAATPSLEFALNLITQTISGATTGAVTEDDNTNNTATGVLQSAAGAITLSDDADADNSVDGTYGTIVFNPSDGTWVYTLDNVRDVTQNLPGGETEEDRFIFTDGTAELTVVITVTGANDAPVVESGNEIGEQAGRVGQEIEAIDLSGLFTDVDTGDTFTLTVMVLSSDGSTKSGLDTLGLEYDSDTKMITGTLLNSVAAGPYTIEVIATDGGGGGAASQPSTFDIVVAADNAPVIGGEVDGTIAEDAADPITGTLTITDAEGDALPTVALTNGAGQYGRLTFVASAEGGVWTYTLDNTNAAVQALGKDDTLTDEFTFTAEGAAPITVTITISGVNDAPTVSGEFFNREGTTGGQFTLSNLSDRFTDVDEGDELTFEVTLDDGAALSTIGLTYNSDEDEITGTLTRTGTYVIKIVATDKIGATVEATFDLNILAAIPIIQRNSLTYNPDATSITIDETMLEVTSGNESDPALLVYTITTLPDAGMLLKSGTPLNNGDTFTQADINNGLITYVPNVSSPHTSQSNPLSFTLSDGVVSLEEQTLEITSREVVGNTAYEGDLSTSGDLDVNDDTLLDSTTPFTISTQGTYGTASIGDDGEWVYTLDNGNADVRALNSGDTLTDTFVVDVNLASGRAKTQIVTITISGRTDVFDTNGEDSSLGDVSTSDNQAIFGFNSSDSLTGGSGDDLLVGGYGADRIDLSAGGTDTVVYRINSSYIQGGARLVKAEDGTDTVFEFTPGEDKLVILDVNGSPTTLAGLFDSLTKDAFQLRISGDADNNGDLSSSELDAGARYYIQIVFDVSGTDDGGSGGNAGHRLIILFDRVTSEALNDRAVWDTLTGGTNFSESAISTVAQLSSLFGGFGRPGYDAALDDGGFISIIGPDDLPDSYFISVLNVDTSGSDIVGAVYEGDPSTSGDLDVSDDTLLASTTPFTISTQGTYGTASIGDDGEWVYKLDSGHADVRALNSGDTLTDTFVVDVNPASGRAKTQTVTITISGRTDVFGTNGPDSSLGDASTSDNQAIFGFNYGDTLTGGSGDDLLVGGYGIDNIDLSAGGTDTVVFRINSSDIQGGVRLVKAEDGEDVVREFTPGEDKLVILDVNGSPTTLAGLFDSLTKFHFLLRRHGDDDRSGDLSSSELDAGARAEFVIFFQVSGTEDGGPTSNFVGGVLRINFDRVTSEALNDRAVWDTLTGGTNFSKNTISTVAQLSSLFGGFGRPGYDAALDDGGFISIIGPDDLPDSYFEPVLNVDTSGSDIVSAVYEGDLSTSGDLDVNDDTLLASTTPFTISTQGTYGTASIGDDGEWVYKLDNGNADVRALNSGDTLTDTFVVDVNRASGRATTQTVTITISGRTDVFGTNGGDNRFSEVGDASTSDNQAIFGFNRYDILRGGSGDDLLVGGYGRDTIDLSAGGTDTVVYRINSSYGDGFVSSRGWPR